MGIGRDPAESVRFTEERVERIQKVLRRELEEEIEVMCSGDTSLF